MQDVKPTPQTHTTPVAHTGKIAGSEPIFRTPIVLLVARGFILFLSLTIMALSGVLMSGLVMDAYAFSLVCALFSIIIVVWELVSEKVPACHVAYNYFALLALDLFMAILWLSSMGANAANRASFIPNTTSGPVVIRNIKKRATATPAGLAYMSAIAGLSAIQMLLFIATTAYFGHQTRKHLEAKKAAAAPDNAAFEMKAQSQPMLAEQQQKSQTAPIVQQLTGGTSYASPVDYTYHHQEAPSQVQPYDSSAYVQPQAGTHQQPAYTHGGHSQAAVTPVPQELPYRQPSQC